VPYPSFPATGNILINPFEFEAANILELLLKLVEVIKLVEE
jgi:hypothetical protein